MFEVSAIGVGDVEVDVLDRFMLEDSVSEVESGMLVFTSNYEFTIEGNLNSLPKTGVVAIESRHNEKNGHIQTLCMEKGLICIYPDYHQKRMPVSYADLREYGRVRVISNGIRARVYKIEENH